MFERYYSRLHGGAIPDHIGHAAVLRELIELDTVTSRVHLAEYGNLDITKPIIEFIIERPLGFDVPGFYYDKISELAEQHENKGELLKSIALRSLLGQKTEFEISY